MSNKKHKEIEAKAHVKQNQVELLKETLISRFGTFEKESKEDLYLRTQNGDIRIRKCDGKYIYTKKQQSMRGGIEVNDETEYTLNYSEVEDHKKNHKSFLEKNKNGYIWSTKVSINDNPSIMNIELVNVDGKFEDKPQKDLGWFLEVEVLVEDDEESTINIARDYIENFFKGLDLFDSIEKLKYMTMLEKE